MFKWRLQIVVLFLLLLFIFSGCGNNQKQTQTQTEEVRPQIIKQAVECAEIIKERINNDEYLTDSEHEKITNFIESTNNNHSEFAISDLIFTMSSNLFNYTVNNEENQLNVFNNNHQKLKKLIGENKYNEIARSLDSSNTNTVSAENSSNNSVKINILDIKNTGYRVEIQLSVQNNSNDTIYVSSIDFTLSDLSGNTIKPGDESLTWFEGIHLQKGQKTEGKLIFIVQAPKECILNFNNISGDQQIKINVPQ